MKRWVRFAATLVVAGVVTGGAWAQEHTTATEPAKAEAGLPAPMSGFADDGVFHLYKNESRLATMSFTWKKDGSFEGHSTLTMAGQSIDSSIRLEPDKDGRWRSISMETPLGPVEVKRAGETARITHKDERETVTLKPDTMLFENFTPALMSQAVRAYDFEQGGKQGFPLFIVPARVMEGSLEFTDEVERTIVGRDVTFRRLTYGVFFTLGAIWWADVLESEATADLSGAVISEIGEKKYQKLLMPLPVIDLDKAVLGKENPYWRKWVEHPVHDPYWQRSAFLDRLYKVDIPVFHQSGWFDGDGIGSKLNYMRMVSHGHPYQKLVLGPWGHTPEPHRRDILVYTSEPLTEDLTFAGPLSAVLYASTSAKDTDWFVRLVEMDKEGRIFPLAEGKIRARYRNSMSKPELLDPGKVYAYKTDL